MNRQQVRSLTKDNLGIESIFLSDNTGDHIKQQGQYLGPENQNVETANSAFGSSIYKTLLAFVGDTMVGSARNNIYSSVCLSQ